MVEEEEEEEEDEEGGGEGEWVSERVSEWWLVTRDKEGEGESRHTPNGTTERGKARPPR